MEHVALNNVQLDYLARDDPQLKRSFYGTVACDRLPKSPVKTQRQGYIVGPSGCGKTVFTEKLLLENADLFENPPTQMHYCYGAWQDRFRGMQDRGVVFHEGIPDHDALVQWFPQGQGVLVLDNLMDEGSHDKRVLDLFTKHSHHQGVTVLYLCQDMFPVGRYA